MFKTLSVLSRHISPNPTVQVLVSSVAHVPCVEVVISAIGEQSKRMYNCTLFIYGCITNLRKLKTNKYYLKRTLKWLNAEGSLARPFRVTQSMKMRGLSPLT